MRAIKFRAWDTEQKAMLSPATIQEICEDAIIHRGLMFLQYTGLKDLHGREIYEGDIVRITDVGGYLQLECYWDLGSLAFRVRTAGYSQDLHVSDEPDVIGNIYENPELLKR